MRTFRTILWLASGLAAQAHPVRRRCLRRRMIELPFDATIWLMIMLGWSAGTAVAQVPPRAMVDMLAMASRPMGSSSYWWPADGGESMGLAAWLRADKGLYHSNGVEILAANGNATNMAPIRVWSNQVQSAAWNTNLNGVNWASSGLVGSYYHPANSTALSGGNVSVQGNWTAANANNNYLTATWVKGMTNGWTVFCVWAVSPTNNATIRMVLDGRVQNDRIRVDTYTPSPYVQVNNVDNTTIGKPAWTNTWFTFMMAKEDATHYWTRTNGVTCVTNSYTATGVVRLAHLNLNFDNIDNVCGSQYIYELLIYDRKLDYAGVQAVEGYLAKRKAGTQ